MLFYSKVGGFLETVGCTSETVEDISESVGVVSECLAQIFHISRCIQTINNKNNHYQSNQYVNYYMVMFYLDCWNKVGSNICEEEILS